MDLYAKMRQVLLEGNVEEIKELTQRVLQEGSKAKEVLEKGFFREWM